MADIIEKIKDVLCHKINGKVFDQDAANALGINNILLATWKKRNHIPHFKIYEFCSEHDVSIESIVFKKGRQHDRVS